MSDDNKSNRLISINFFGNKSSFNALWKKFLLNNNINNIIIEFFKVFPRLFSSVVSLSISLLYDYYSIYQKKKKTVLHQYFGHRHHFGGAVFFSFLSFVNFLSLNCHSLCVCVNKDNFDDYNVNKKVFFIKIEFLKRNQSIK